MKHKKILSNTTKTIKAVAHEAQPNETIVTSDVAVETATNEVLVQEHVPVHTTTDLNNETVQNMQESTEETSHHSISSALVIDKEAEELELPFENHSDSAVIATNTLINECTSNGGVDDDLAALFEKDSTIFEEKDFAIDLDEVDDSIGDLLATGSYITSCVNNATRQLNAMLAIVNHTNGKRSKIHGEVRKNLRVQVGDLLKVTVKDKQVILFKSIDGIGIPLKKGGYLYSTELVKAITKEFAFDYSDQSTHHLLHVTYKKWNNQVIAIITP